MRQITNVSCILAGVIATGIGVATRSADLQIAGLAVAGFSVLKLLGSDAIIIDGQLGVVRRKQGVWPFVIEGSKPFSEVDHVLIEELPQVESDGSEYVEARLSLVSKSGPPILLAKTDKLNGTFIAKAQNVAQLIGVQAFGGSRVA